MRHSENAASFNPFRVAPGETRLPYLAISPIANEGSGIVAVEPHTLLVDNGEGNERAIRRGCHFLL
jgi:hypothetical protein